jgi:hypothetical protein
LPARERPANRLREVGPTSVSATKVLANAREAEMVQVRGIGPSSATRIQAAFELGRHMILARPEGRLVVRPPAPWDEVARLDEEAAEYNKTLADLFTAVLVDNGFVEPLVTNEGS